VVRRTDAAGVPTNCFFRARLQHRRRRNPDSDGRVNTGTRLWNWVEGRWCTTCRAWPINDGTDPRYQQAAAKGPGHRVPERALLAGPELSTEESMEADYRRCLAQQADTTVGAPDA